MTKITTSRFNYDSILREVENQGKMLYGTNFCIVEHEREIWLKVLSYLCKDDVMASKLNISLHKGIFLNGPIGCGKTTVFRLLNSLNYAQFKFLTISTREVSFEYAQFGFTTILKYSKLSFTHKHKPRICCFDDLGAENEIKLFGNSCNVMAEILNSRYDYYVSDNMITHITSNLNGDEILDLYGNRVRSRLRQMCNLISFDRDTLDKRK